ncbi:DoxX family protein [Paenibacillus sedimenti]|uniref:DoxX family protein n=1 Tax=Paenibacillus sedimenti TaxID=2770274 RepID=A0A926QJW6_9BACL|nr:DoxX family protein [Paenibacillus sedimenti]MBD0381970.1 DoxX family protein [Paenibacillus sedimenti]
MQIVSIILQSILALIFLMAASGKLAGSKAQIEAFNHLRLPQWFRIVTGLTQLIGVAAVVIGFWEPSWAAAGALWLAIISLGGILSHVRVKDTFKQAFMIVLLFVLSLVLFMIQNKELASFPGF